MNQDRALRERLLYLLRRRRQRIWIWMRRSPISPRSCEVPAQAWFTAYAVEANRAHAHRPMGHPGV